MGISVSMSLTIFPKDASGGVAQSARDADSIFLGWALTNDLPSQSLTLTFPGARLFVIDLIRADGTIPWSSPSPPPIPDWTFVLPPGPTLPFRIPIIPIPDDDALKQVPLIPLAELCARLGIPPDEELLVRFTVPVTQGPLITTLQLWR
ncbi:hypothetical protein [Sinorhizobium fredii]|uniref:hypothetical protein n=1 Tax=Rhizobium fredii TaxID=380 RepID=UPI00117EF3C5|nr:hypothetical protein [Sinorhizobium fredii]